MYNVDIDTGGTMTDGLVCGDGTVLALKVETTPHDVTVAFLDILKAAQRELGFADLRSFLDRVEVIRWSSTITSNVLAQRVGPKLGLLVSAGHEKDLYDAEAARSVVGVLVSAEDITGLPAGADEPELRLAIKSLLDRGIRRINVSLRDAFPDGSAERRIVELIAQDYPDHFLGSIPALAGSDVVLRHDDSTRTIASLINAYVHPALATSLYRAEEIVRDEHGWQGNVLIGHINGGVARIGKTKAFDTIESGPLFGTHACAVTAGRFGDDRVIAIDVGGTTAKASAVQAVPGDDPQTPESRAGRSSARSDRPGRAGRVVVKESGDLFDIPLRLDMPLLRSIALGGGSVARVADGRVVLGPDSMGAAPGPACYGLGGRNATVTDAFFLCGFISPTAFLGGKRTLDADRARAALDKHVGTPLGLDSQDAARAVVNAAWDAVAQLARETAEEAGWDPADCVVYAYGGNGPLFVTAVADRLGARDARFFRFGHVYSAYGSAISDVVHVYESALTGPDHLAATGARLADQAHRDLRAEGFDPSAASLTWEIRSKTGTAYSEGALPPTPHPTSPKTDTTHSEGTPPPAPHPKAGTAHGEGDHGASLEAGIAYSEGAPPPVAHGASPEVGGGAVADGGGPVLVRLTARYPLPTLRQPELDGAGGAEVTGSRTSPFGAGGVLPTYDGAGLAGASLAGPLLVDGGSYTWLVTDGWSLTTDACGDASLTRG